MILYEGGRNVLGSGMASWDIAAFSTYLACFLKLAVKSSHAAKLFNAVQKAQVSWQRIPVRSCRKARRCLSRSSHFLLMC